METNTMTLIAATGWRLIQLVLDRSYSMHSIKTQTEQGARVFLADQRNVPGRTTVSLTQFDHEVEPLFTNRDLSQVPAITLKPCGQTALLDAMGQTITRARHFVRGLPKPYRPDEIITVVLTDGLENASRTFNQDTVHDMIGELQSKKRVWKFVLLGANDAVHTLAHNLGIDSDTAIQYDHDLSEAALSSAGQMIARGSRTGHYGFTDEERRQTRH
ncbi:hypothetical protein ACTWPT_37415 [Nonomuraea sp. 3N208]|uniref:hypothetical protein n=1 Tax=Nonomuraea sp. 3N208 TaxID=3457421 RepID=UPI003FD272B1